MDGPPSLRCGCGCGCSWAGALVPVGPMWVDAHVTLFFSFGGLEESRSRTAVSFPMMAPGNTALSEGANGRGADRHPTLARQVCRRGGKRSGRAACSAPRHESFHAACVALDGHRRRRGPGVGFRVLALPDRPLHQNLVKVVHGMEEGSGRARPGMQRAQAAGGAGRRRQGFASRLALGP